MMPYMVCVEESEGRWIAHVPDLPGCFIPHKEKILEQAIQTVPKAVEDYMAWSKRHKLEVVRPSDPMVVVEVIRTWESEGGYEVNAFFASDRPPLIKEELQHYKRLFAATRKDLLEAVEDLDEDDLAREFPDERWPIGGVLLHVARAEWWYLDRLGMAFPSAELPTEPFECLTKVRKHLLKHLPSLASYDGVVTDMCEAWSARKVMRRALWHERDHTRHILKLRALLPQK